MIRIIYSDGSEGRKYQVGDRVIVHRTVHGRWFDYGPTHADVCIVRKIDKERTNPKDTIAFMEIWYSNDWGYAYCSPWGIEPHPDTIEAATVMTREEFDAM